MTKSYIQSIKSGAVSHGTAPIITSIISIAFFLFMAKLNINVVRNLLAKRQVMNGSFDKLRLCGTYGAFGVVAEQREELIIESANDIKGPWKEYQFKVKPGDVHRRPRWISPYHHRLDWQMWIAAQSGTIERSQWLVSLLLKLVRQEKDVVDLIESDPWKTMSQTLATCDEGKTPESHANEGINASPKYIRIEKYVYKFYDGKKNANANVQVGKSPHWTRERVGRYFPRQGVMTEDMLEKLVNKQEH